MRISKFEIANFRSYKEATIIPGSKINVIVGENNVGKSNLLAAIQFLKSLGGVGRDDWPDGKANGPLALSLECSLRDQDIAVIAYELEVSVEEFKKSFGDNLAIRIIGPHPNRNPEVSVEFGSLQIFADNTFGIHPVDLKLGYQSIDWREVVSLSRKSGRLLLQVAKEMTEQRKKQNMGVEVRMGVGKSMYDAVGRIFRESLFLFPEFRQRPQRAAAEVLSSPEGSQVAAVLFNLKNGTREEREKFEKIQEYFSSLFPTLKLNVTKQGPTIVIEKTQTGHEVPLEFIGAGIAQMIILLTHIVGSEARVFLVDGPELHLHPHSQRLLQKVFEESTANNQLLIITHSPQFVNLQDPDSIILIREVGGRSHVIRLSPNYLSEEEKNRLSRIVRSEDKEFLFSRRVLLVEGETEYGAIPIFAQTLNTSLDEYGVSLVSVGGSHFGLLLKILRGFKFPCRVMCDRDVLMRIADKIKIENVEFKTSLLFQAISKAGSLSNDDVKMLSEFERHIIQDKDKKGNSIEYYDAGQFNRLNKVAQLHGFHVLSPDFEGVLEREGYEELLHEAASAYGRSKVRQGRYVAQKIERVPKAFEEIIQEIIRL
jgi:predicted ATP-dependent endonuclease of OLD family